MTWNEQDIITAASQCNDSKVLGEDWAFVALLKDKDVGQNLRLQLVRMLNEDSIPDYLKHARLVLFTKNGKSCAGFFYFRPIAVLSQLTKVLENAIKNKLEESESGLLNSRNYQSGF